jgi:hypothetical protein
VIKLRRIKHVLVRNACILASKPEEKKFWRLKNRWDVNIKLDVK